MKQTALRAAAALAQALGNWTSRSQGCFQVVSSRMREGPAERGSGVLRAGLRAASHLRPPEGTVGPPPLPPAPRPSGSSHSPIGCAAGARRVRGRARARYKATEVTARGGARRRRPVIRPRPSSASPPLPAAGRGGAMEGVSALLARCPTAGLAGGLGVTACAAAGVLLYRIARR